MRGSAFSTSAKAILKRLKKDLIDSPGACSRLDSDIISLAFEAYNLNCSLNFCVKSENLSTDRTGSFVNQSKATPSRYTGKYRHLISSDALAPVICQSYLYRK